MVVKSPEQELELFQNSPMMIFKWQNQEGWPVEFVSGNVQRILGYTAEEFVQGRVLYTDIIHPDDLARVVAEVNRHSSQKENDQFEHQPYRLIAKDGKVVWTLDYRSVVRNDAGNITHHLSCLIDIAGRTQKEEALRAREDRLSKIMCIANDGMWNWDLLNNEVYFDPRYYKMAGYETDEFPHRLEEFQKRVHPDDIDYVMDQAQKHLHGEIEHFTVEFRFKKKNDGYLWLLGRGEIVERNENGDPLRLVGIHIDISQRKRIEQKLAKSERNYREIFNAGNDAIFVHNGRTGEVIDVNRTMLEMYGYERDDVIGSTVAGLSSGAAPFDQKNAAIKIRKAIEEGPQIFEWMARKKNGEIFWVEVNLRFFKIVDEERIIAVVRDINARKKSEQELRESEERYQLLSEATFEAIFLSEKGICTGQNSTAEKMFGYTLEEAIGRSGTEWISPEDHDLVMHNMRSDHVNTYEVTARRKNGSTFPCEIQARRMIFKGKNIRITALRDISERTAAEAEHRRLEEQLRQKYKMEAMGLMAGGIAHNFNNNLAIILGNLELAQRKLNIPPELRERLINAKTATLRSRDLVQQILTYGRQGSHDKTPIQLAMVVDETLQLLRSTLPTSLDLQFQIAPEHQHIAINADSSRIQEALINLCTNAVHAMNEKGNLTLSLDNVELQQTDIPARYERTPGQYARLSVKDTGCGIPAETVDKIFDPFFTSKEIGKGTGMGLSTVQGIVDQHGGLIKVLSKPGQGSTFELYFPVTQVEQPETPVANIDLPRGSEKILFLDDEEMLAEVGKEMLTELGYQVTAETSSIKALEMVKANPTRFDLVITDQTMPEMTGKEVIKEINKICPDLPIILTSGYSSKISEEDAVQLSISAFCMKPLQMPELLQTVRKILDK